MTDESKLVPFSRSRRLPDPVRVREFATMARRLQEERDSFATVIARVLNDTPREEWPSLASRASLHTVGALEALAREVEARLDREPREALVIAELATSIAAAIPAMTYPPIVVAQARAHAWKDRGQALCYLARHDEALEALDRADALLNSFGTLAHDLAIIRFVRATTLQEMGRFEESMQLLAECRAVFRAHGDARRSLRCGIAEGCLLHRMKRFREAREMYTALLEVAQELDDRRAEAHLHHDIGYISVELSDFSAAESHLDRAVALARELDWPVQAARSEGARGVLFSRRGEYRRAVSHLKTVRRTFLEHGLVEEAGLCALEIVNARLALGEPHEAESLARQVVLEFTNAGLNSRAITALGYLSEAIAARTASVAMVGGVREYIVSLRKYPEREFVLP